MNFSWVGNSAKGRAESLAEIRRIMIHGTVNETTLPCHFEFLYVYTHW